MEVEYEVIDEKPSDYYLTGDLTERQIEVLDKVLNVSDKGLRKFNKRIQESANLSNRTSSNIVLRDPQIRPMLMSMVTKRFFIGDNPGLGKTVMSAAGYANYKYNLLKRGKKPKKVLVVTTSTHVIGFAKEWKKYGIRLLPLLDGSIKVARTLRNADLSKYDGVILNWDGLKTNGFLDYYLRNAGDYEYAVFDETSELVNNTSLTYQVTDHIVNKYEGGIERVLFLNGTSFEKSILDYYNQFQILYPKLIPNKKFLEDNYIIRGGKPVNVLSFTNGNNQQRHAATRYFGEIIDYKNQSELRDRLKYFYIARSKSDYSDDLPKHNYHLHVVNMTPKQKKQLKTDKNVTLLNSPATTNEKLTLTERNSPKLAMVLDFAEQVAEDRPILYVYNRKSQETIRDSLIKRGFRVEIINGSASNVEKNEIMDKFNRKKLDMLVFNVDKAVNLPTSDRVIFYDIPTMPKTTTQVKGRIDRDNYEDPKFYDFFCYLESPEMVNIVRLAYFREKHGNAFTGQEDLTYSELIGQLTTYYGEDVMDKINEKVEETEDFFDEDEWEVVIDELINE